MILLDSQLPTQISSLATKDEAIDIIKKLELELSNSKTNGVGLSAPQIGINKAVAIIRVANRFDFTNPIHSVNLVNPKLISGEGFITYNEGCLSFPGKYVKTIRYNEIFIETLNDYSYYAEQVNARRLGKHPIKLPLLTNEKRILHFGGADIDNEELEEIQKLVCVCVQHEFSHLLALNMFDFKPQEVGRNDQCPCGAGKKNKKCHNYPLYNKNMEKLFKPNYRGE